MSHAVTLLSHILKANETCPKSDTCDIQKSSKICRDTIWVNTNRSYAFWDISGHFQKMLHFCYIVTSQVLHLLQRPKTHYRCVYSLYLTTSIDFGSISAKKVPCLITSTFVSFTSNSVINPKSDKFVTPKNVPNFVRTLSRS